MPVRRHALAYAKLKVVIDSNEPCNRRLVLLRDPSSPIYCVIRLPGRRAGVVVQWCVVVPPPSLLAASSPGGGPWTWTTVHTHL